MKRFLVLLLCLSTGLMFGQSVKPKDLVQNSIEQGAAFTPTSLFRLSPSNFRTNLPAEVSEYDFVDLQRDQLDLLLKSSGKTLEITIPSRLRSSKQLQLVEVEAPYFPVIDGHSGQQVKYQNGRHYHGIVKGDETSIAAISIFDNEIMGLVSDSYTNGNLVIGKMEGQDKHIIYQDNEVVNVLGLECHTSDNDGSDISAEILRGEGIDTRAAGDCVGLYYEIDNDIISQKGSVNNAINYVTGLHNQVAVMYGNEQIDVNISEIVTWEGSSPYSGTVSNILDQFINRGSINGALGQVLTYKGSGGIAYVNTICHNTLNRGVSSINSSYSNVPTYSWSVMVLTHEFGHTFGSPHTQACAWNGNHTAIDGCVDSEDYRDGSITYSCPTPSGLPSGGGTVMSYCHLTSAGINLNNGFGSQPGNLIRNRVANASCTGNGPCDSSGPTCSDGVQNGNETGVDCGGPDCAPCGSGCNFTDVVVTILTDNYPGETQWTIKNSSGTTVASGGPYSTVGATYTSSVCLEDDCYDFQITDSYGDGICCSYGSGNYTVTAAGSTVASGGNFTNSENTNFCIGGGSGPTCNDGVQNGNETGVDCGGPDCAPCGGGATCNDGVQNGNETGVDCGGPDCAPCATCNDGQQNGNETGVDCGGPDCPACPTCNDGIQNGNETGVDCGGPDCAPCGGTNQIFGHYFENGWDGWLDGGGDAYRYTGSNSYEGNYSIRLRDNSGTASAMTSASHNLSSYNAVTLSFTFYANSMESGEDFWVLVNNGGGWNTVATYSSGSDFSNGQFYTVNINLNNSQIGSNTQFRIQCDASSNADQIYIDAVTLTSDSGGGGPTCNDGIQNGNETGIDCGGPDCGPCGGGSTCNDGIQNGNETGVDCGGPDCPACPTCIDGIQNGNETGVDCGGPDCGPCGGGGSLIFGHYFESGWDGWQDGGTDCYRYSGSNSAEGSYSIRLRDNSGSGSAMTSSTYNLSGYGSVTLRFKFYPNSMENGEDFWVRVDNGSGFNTVASYASGTDFSNGSFYQATITLNSSQIGSNTTFRIQCDASSNADQVYIDEVTLESASSLVAGTIEENSLTELNRFKSGLELAEFFPNPTSDILNIKLRADEEEINNDSSINLALISITGQVIKEFSLSENEASYFQVNVSDIPSGTYFARVIRGESEPIIQKVQIIR